MKKITKSTIIFCVLAIILNLVFMPNLFAASIFDQISGSTQKITNEAVGGGRAVKIDQFTFLNSLMTIINYLLTFLGAVFFLGIIYAGWIWMIARGNEEEINKAKEIMKQFLVGLIIILTARILTEFILTNIGTITQ